MPHRRLGLPIDFSLTGFVKTDRALTKELLAASQIEPTAGAECTKMCVQRISTYLNSRHIDVLQLLKYCRIIWDRSQRITTPFMDEFIAQVFRYTCLALQQKFLDTEDSVAWVNEFCMNFATHITLEILTAKFFPTLYCVHRLYQHDHFMHIMQRLGFDCCGTQVGVNDYNNTYLMSLIMNECRPRATLLIKNLSFQQQLLKDTQGKTVIIMATKTKQADILQALLAATVGTSAEAIARVVNLTDEWGNSALHYACAYADVEMMRMLIQHGGNLQLLNQAGKSCVDMLMLDEGKITELLNTACIDSSRDEMAVMNTVTKPDGSTLVFVAADQHMVSVPAKRCVNFIASIQESIRLQRVLDSEAVQDKVDNLTPSESVSFFPQTGEKYDAFMAYLFRFTGRSVLQAIIESKPRAIALLQECKADCTPLITPNCIKAWIKGNHLAALRSIVSAWVHIPISPNGAPPIFTAVIAGNKEAFVMFLEAGARVDEPLPGASSVTLRSFLEQRLMQSDWLKLLPPYGKSSDAEYRATP